jgi:hypothetical protein
MIAFARHDINHEPIIWTSRKIAAAKAAVTKERQRAGLFGEELMRFTTVEERMAMIEARNLLFVRRSRSFEAKTWAEARRKFGSLPISMQAEIKAYWNSFKHLPKTATNFADLLYQIEIDPKFLARKRGEASPYTRTIVSGGKVAVVEISKEEHEKLTWGAVK